MPVVMSDADPESQIEALKRDPAFNRTAGAGPDSGKGFSGVAAPEAGAAAAATATVSDADRKWELKVWCCPPPTMHVAPPPHLTAA